MGVYFCFSPPGVDAAGGTARVILREVEVLLGAGAFYLGFKGGYLNGGSS